MKRVVFSPDSDVRRASYEYYHFDRNAFLRFFGGAMPTEAVEVVVRIHGTSQGQNQPSDPRHAAPRAALARQFIEQS